MCLHCLIENQGRVGFKVEVEVKAEEERRVRDAEWKVESRKCKLPLEMDEPFGIRFFNYSRA